MCRFSYLLHKGRYQEALDFAHLYEFSDEEIQVYIDTLNILVSFILYE